MLKQSHRADSALSCAASSRLVTTAFASIALLASCDAGGVLTAVRDGGAPSMTADGGAAIDAPLPVWSADAPALAGLDDPAEAVPVEGLGVVTLAGSADIGYRDGARAVARFNNPTNVALGPDLNVYVADFENSAIRLVRPSGMTLTFTRQKGFSHPFGMAFAPDGALYVQTDGDDLGRRDESTGMLWRLDRRTGVATPVLRDLGRPRGLLVLPDGRVVMVDNEHHVVRLLDPVTLQVSVLAGTRDARGYADGTGAAARFDHPYDVVRTPDNVLLVADQNNHRLRAITLQGEVSTFAGTGVAGFANGPRALATFDQPQGLAVDSLGNVYVSDMGNYVVRRVGADGLVTTAVGAGRPGYNEGAPADALFFGMEGIDVSPNGETLVVADGNRGGDESSHRVRRIGLVIEPN